MSKRDIDLIRAKIGAVRPDVDVTESMEDIGKSALVNAYFNDLLDFIEKLEEGKLAPFYIKQLLGEKQ